MKWWHGVLMGVGLVVFALFGFLIGQHYPLKSPIMPIEEKVDTFYLHDTITLSKPIYVERRVTDKVYVPVTDTLRIRDTLFVEMEKESLEWRDSLCSVYASGVMCSVDSVRHYVTERVIVKEVPYQVTKKTRWGLGVQVGGGVGVSGGRIVAVPYVGVGVSYNLISW